jgi:hypothetical protein
MKVCNNCGKTFRDTFDLKRHNQRKKPCNKELNNVNKVNNVNNVNKVTDTSGNVYNFNLTINVLGKEDLSHIDPVAIIDYWRNLNRDDNDEYVRAGKLVINFHGLVRQNPLNRNVTLSNFRSPVAKTVTETGVIVKETKETVSDVVKTRAGQLVTFKDSIHNVNDRVFKVPKNVTTWKHIEQFGNKGLEHQDSFINTRSVKTLAKVAII